MPKPLWERKPRDTEMVVGPDLAHAIQAFGVECKCVHGYNSCCGRYYIAEEHIRALVSPRAEEETGERDMTMDQDGPAEATCRVRVVCSVEVDVKTPATRETTINALRKKCRDDAVDHFEAMLSFDPPTNVKRVPGAPVSGHLLALEIKD